MTWFMGYDRASGEARGAGECPAGHVADQATAQRGVIPLLRKGVVLVEEMMPAPGGGLVPTEVVRIDLSAAVEALLAHVGGDILAHAAVVEAVPNLALMAAAAETAGPLFPETSE